MHFGIRSGVIVISLGLATCTAAPDAKIYPLGAFGQNVVGNEAYVTISSLE